MIHLNKLQLTLASIAFVGAAAAAAIQGTATPVTPQVLGTDGGPAWHDSQDIGNGVELETSIGFLENVTVPASGTTVRPISIHVNFLYGVGLLHQTDYLKLHPIADTTAFQLDVKGLDRSLVVSQRPPHGALDYQLTIAPKTGFTWGTIRGTVDLDIVAVQL